MEEIQGREYESPQVLMDELLGMAGVKSVDVVRGTGDRYFTEFTSLVVRKDEGSNYDVHLTNVGFQRQLVGKVNKQGN